jgi:hypothetical protein
VGKPALARLNRCLIDASRKKKDEMIKPAILLNRFTSIDSLFDILKTNKIRLSNSKYWEDKNDASYIDAYKHKKHLKTVFALCFTDDYETIYHWSAFSEKVNELLPDRI